MDTLICLQRLVLSSNRIEVLPGALLTPLTSSLKVLILDNNQLVTLPDEICTLSMLEKLSVKGNRLEQVNPHIGSLPCLQLLLLTGNRLTALPDSLGGCEQLEELDASGNQIREIPGSLGQLQKLKTLNLNNNLVTQVPPQVFLSCAALQTLGLHGNPIKPDTLQETEGFEAFEQRRRDKYSKVIAGGASLGPRGLDEGIDRKTNR